MLARSVSLLVRLIYRFDRVIQYELYDSSLNIATCNIFCKDRVSGGTRGEPPECQEPRILFAIGKTCLVERILPKHY